MSNELKEAIMNPNTDFMTKLLFDARWLEKKYGQDLTYWSNAIVKTKFLLSEKKSLNVKEIASKIKHPEADVQAILDYLKGMAEILEDKGKYTLNLKNAFSSMFKKN